MDAVIQIEDLTKDYGQHRGVFDINLEIERGEIFGFVGTNGAGKTTTIRNIMGFIKPDKGKVTVEGMDSWHQATEIKRLVSYIPGEIAFPSMLKGTDFLKSQAGYLGIKDLSYMNKLLDALKLDPTANLSRMSKGMKQKTAIVAALMGDENILVLDEPTTGLDPLMRDVFIDLLKEERDKGKTVFMSSHIFEEVEEICDRVALIKNGDILSVAAIEDIGSKKVTTYEIEFADREEADKFAAAASEKKDVFEMVQSSDSQPCIVSVKLNREHTKELFRLMSDYKVASLIEEKNDLETYFNKIYREEGKQ